MIDTESAGARSKPQSQKLLVVGIGASAGGIEALRQFFANVPQRSGAAYVVILHLSPDHDSKLAEVLQTTASIPVTQVTHPVHVEADHVYVVAPNKRMEILDGALSLSEMTQREHRRSPVDVFFRALADAHGSRSVGIVLSGTGPNGSAGLKRVKEYGGLTIAQSPDEAGYPDMPNNAIATGQVDLVLRVADMPARIADYHTRLNQLEASPATVIDSDDEPDALREILSLLRVRTGHDFSNYKPGTLMRRLHRRLHIVEVTSLNDYARLIREQPQEAVMLMKDLLISVTHFFRDPEVFAVLEQRVVPRLFERRGPDDQIRVWVPGCATGEEAYSIAMLLSEYADGMVEPPHLQLFATDLDEDAITAAREGFYTGADVVDVPEKRLERFFSHESNGYRVRRDLREMMLFAHHNVVKDPPFSHLDLISCRNLLIYLNRTAQERIFETFHFALRPSALLMLGSSESPEGSTELFVPFERAAHLYESRMVTSRVVVPDAPKLVPTRPTRTTESRSVERLAPLEAHHRLLEEYAPPSLIVTEDHAIVHMSPRAAPYLQMSAGEPSRDLLKLVRPELRAELRTALFQAGKNRISVDVKNIAIVENGTERHVTVIVRPVLRDDDPTRGFFLVLFADSDISDGPDHTVRTLDAKPEPFVVQLEEELSRVKAQLRTTIEQYEAQVEEAQASAEEHQAMNEELRSSAEELETSKEEIQSVNEELTTVNQELKIKIEELRLSNNDFQNLINSTEIATIFLDRSLRLKFVTPRAQDIFNLLRTDVGRPLSDITTRLVNASLDTDLHLVLEQLQPVDREVMTTDNRWFLMRIRPYRTTDDRIDGVVLMFQDITARRQAEHDVAWSEERLRLLIDSVVDYAIFTITADGRIQSWNTGAQRMFGYDSDEVIGRPFGMLYTKEDRDAGVAADELERARRDGAALDERYHVRSDGTLIYASGVTTRLGEGSGLGFAKIARDLTAQQGAAEALRQAHADLDKRVAERTKDLDAAIADQQAAQIDVVNLLRKVVTAQEDERGRIARNLHDQLGQRLTALRLSLERVQEHLKQEEIRDDELERALDLTHIMDQDVGFLSWELRPAVLDHLGLGAALPRYTHEWSEHYSVEVAYNGDSFQPGMLSHEAEVAFYRIAQEALTNVAKHAHASRVDVMLEMGEQFVVLVIEDDGVGFDHSDSRSVERGVGLLGMRERAGLIGAAFQIESRPGEGTSIFVRYRRADAPVTQS
ncbi:MAG TPA: chemotaxis protein CheB [Vicinamibacterales bacterium]|nr:chemotaxis protein CheB [Vicinamibacterales bacterium]